MMDHFRALSGKFTGSQVNKNKDSDLSYYWLKFIINIIIFIIINIIILINIIINN